MTLIVPNGEGRDRWISARGQRASVSMNELLAGQWLSTQVCPHCGHPPDDFVDKKTIVE